MQHARTYRLYDPVRSACQCLLLSIALLPVQSCPAEEKTSRQVSPGVVLHQEIQTGAAPLVVHTLDLNLNMPGIRVRCGQARDAIVIDGDNTGREQISTLAARNHALAAINADFFPFTGDPLGLAIRDGELLSEPPGYRACLGFGPKGPRIDVLIFSGSIQLPDGSRFNLSGVNRMPAQDEWIVLSPSFHSTPMREKPFSVLTLSSVDLPLRLSTPIRGRISSLSSFPAHSRIPGVPRGGVLLIASPTLADNLKRHLHPGDQAVLKFDLYQNQAPLRKGRYLDRLETLPKLSSSRSPCWSEMQQAVGGGALLLKNGKIALDAEAEGFDPVAFIDRRHPRTAVGLTAEGHLLLVAVDGRSPVSQGVSLMELTALMKRMGARDAINLDGGGSTTLVVQGAVVNAPSDGRERYVANGLLVYGPPFPTSLPPGAHLATTLKDGFLTVGSPVNFALVDGKNAPIHLPVVWGTDDGLGFISQHGTYSSLHSGTGAILASVGSHRYKIGVRIRSGPPALLRAALYMQNRSENRSNLILLALSDRYGNPVSGRQVQIQALNGRAPKFITTDNTGHARTKVEWSGGASRRAVALRVGNLPVQTIRASEARLPRTPNSVPIDPDDR